MTLYTVRSDVTAAAINAPAADSFVLDWQPGARTASIECKPDFFDGWRPTRAAADMLVFAAAAYCADKTTPRAAARDAWTRDIGLVVPVDPTAGFDGDGFAHALGFLTGDRWTVGGYPATSDPLAVLPEFSPPLVPFVDVDAVSLFSGGLDSLSQPTAARDARRIRHGKQ